MGQERRQAEFASICLCWCMRTRMLGAEFFEWSTSTRSRQRQVQEFGLIAPSRSFVERFRGPQIEQPALAQTTPRCHTHNTNKWATSTPHSPAHSQAQASVDDSSLHLGQLPGPQHIRQAAAMTSQCRTRCRSRSAPSPMCRPSRSPERALPVSIQRRLGE